MQVAALALLVFAGDPGCILKAKPGADVSSLMRALVTRCAGKEIIVPSGTYTTAPFNITGSGTTLRLQRGATLLASKDTSAYPLLSVAEWLPSYRVSRDDRTVPPFSAFEHQPLVLIHGASNVRVTGPGTIDGTGAAWWSIRNTKALRHGRPRLIQVHSATGVVVDGGLTLRNSPFWTLHLYRSRNVIVRDVTVENPKDVDNTDGIDPDSSSDIVIERTNITCGDDAIAIKSGWDEAGIAVGASTTNVTVRDSVFDCENGVSIGSEMSGGVRGISVRNLTLSAFHRAFYIKTAATRGGRVVDVTVQDVRVRAAREVFAILRNYSNPNPTNPPGFAPPPPQVANVTFANVVADAVAEPGFDDDGVPTGITAAGQFSGAADAPLTGLFVADVLVTNNTVGFLCDGPVSSSGSSPHNVTPSPCWT